MKIVWSNSAYIEIRTDADMLGKCYNNANFKRRHEAECSNYRGMCFISSN